MVILDSDHSKEHVVEELDRYAPMVTAGCYLIVEDTNPFAYNGPAGPERALRAWQPTNKGFEIDRDVEPFLTCHPGGYLRRAR
jgi:cephalosporin hydroxylase